MVTFATSAMAQSNFPYRAEFSCLIGNGATNEMGLFQCLSGKYTDGSLEITNGSDYSFLKSRDVMQYGHIPNVIDSSLYATFLSINLNQDFSIKMYSPNDTFITGLKIIDNATGKIVWQKKTSSGWIMVSNN